MCFKEDLAGKSDPISNRWRRASVIFFLLVLVVAYSTIGDYGMGWDEPTRWSSGDSKLDYYAKLLSSDQPLEVIRNAGNDDYPGFFDMTLGMVHRLTGWDRFALGHWQAFFFGLAGVFAVWRIGIIFGGGRLGFWSCVLLVLTPVFYGHWFHNPKDIPFAATYTLALWGIIEWLRRFPEFKKRWFVLASILCGLCMAVRIAGMVLLAYLVAGVFVLAVVYYLGNRGKKEPKLIFKKLIAWVLAVPMAGVLAYLTLIPWWPAGHRGVFSSSSSTLQSLHTRASEIPLFFRGAFMEAADAPHYYTLWMFGIKAPEVLLMGILIAAIMVLFLLQKHGCSERLPRFVAPLSVLLLGGFFPLLYLTYSGPALHNGARHFLFAFPALCVVAAWGWLQLLDWIKGHRPQLQLIARIVFGIFLALPLWHLIQLHPYQYVYFNSLAGGPANAINQYEGEYWFTSSKHAIEKLDAFLSEYPKKKPEGKTIDIFILGPWQVAEPFLPRGYRLVSKPEEADFLILNTQMRVYEQFEGEDLFSIARMGAPICIVRRTSRNASAAVPFNSF
jgi:hypothetical protein